MNKLLLPIIIMLILVSTVSAITLDIPISQTLIEGEQYDMPIILNSDTKFPGAIYLYYTNVNSPTTIIPFDENSFTGNAPYILQDTLTINSGLVGQYSIKAEVIHSNGTIMTTRIVSGNINTSAPKVISKSPSGVITNPATTLVIKTNEDAICKYSSSNTSYDNMSAVFTLTGETTHSQIIGGLSETTHKYYVRCKDLNGYVMQQSAVIEFVVDLPPSAEIEISDESPVTAGTIEVTVVTSESLEIPPKLEYSFEDNPNQKTIISLTGKDSLWKGYMIITSDDDNKVGTFYFTGTDNRGTKGSLITDGNIFVVDTSKPKAPINIETFVQANGEIKIKWYYEGEPIEHFNIYRSTESGVDYIDYYSTADNGSQFMDRSVTDKVTYHYKVAGIDEAGNIGILSEEVYATSVKKSSVSKEEDQKTTEEPKVLPPNLVLRVDDYLQKLDQLNMDIDEVSTTLSDPAKNELIQELNLQRFINDAKETIQKLTDQLKATIKVYKTESEIDSELKQVDIEIKKIQQTVPKDINLIEDSQYIESTNIEDTRNAAAAIFTDFTDKQLSNYVKHNNELQKDMTITVNVKSISIKYLDESIKKITKANKKITYENPEPLKEIIVVEQIPDSFGVAINNIAFTPDVYTKLTEDKIKFGFMGLDFNGQTIEYEINQEISSEQFKATKTIVLVAPIEAGGASDVVGYSIFPTSDLSALEVAGLIIGLSIIVILLGYYLIFITKIHKKVGKQISKLKKKGKIFKTGELDEYPDIHKIEKIEVISKIDNKKKLEHMQDLILMCQEYISIEDYDKASQIYPQIRTIYSQIPKQYQQQHYRECIEIQKNITDGKKIFFDSIL